MSGIWPLGSGCIQSLEEDFGGNCPELFHGLSNDGERRYKHVGQFNVVEADYGDVSGHFYSQFAQGANESTADQVITAEECGRRLFSIEQSGGRLEYQLLR